MGSTRDESEEVKQQEEEEEERGLNRRSSKRLRLLEDGRKSCLRRGKRLRYHLEEEEEGHERDEEEEEEGHECDEEEEEEEGHEHDEEEEEEGHERDEEEEEDIDVTWFGPGSSSRPRDTPDKKRASSVELDVIPVTCGGRKGTLNVEQLARGEMCIECEGGWFSPPAFENFGGKGYYKKWKKSIYYEDQPLESLFKQGLLMTPGFKKKRNTEDKKMNNCRKMDIGGHMVPVLHRYHFRVLRKDKQHDEVSGEDEDSEGESRTDNNSEMKEEGEKKWFILKGYEDIKSGSKQQSTSLKIPLTRLSATKISILSSNSREDLKSADNWCMPLEDIDDVDEAQHSEEPREDSTATETEDMTTIPLLTNSRLLNSCHSAKEVNTEEIRCRDREMWDNQIQEETEIAKGSSASETCRRALPITLQMTKTSPADGEPYVRPFPIFSISNEHDDQAVVSHSIMTTATECQEEDGPIKTELCEEVEQVGEGNIKEEQIKIESDGQSSSHSDGRHTSGSENNTPTGKTNDKTVQQQSIQSEAATSTLLSQNHCLPSSVPNAQNTKTRAYYGFRRKRPSSLVWKRHRCGQDKAQEKKRDRRDVLMLTTLRKICDSQHRMCEALERLGSKQDVVIELLKTLTDRSGLCSHTG